MNTSLFIEVLAENKFFHEAGSLKKLTSIELIKSPLYPKVRKIYEDELGGLQETLPFTIPSWDIELKNLKLAIKIDSSLDYHRFRTRTFRSELYEHLPIFSVEKTRLVCQRQEKDCLKKGGLKAKWTSKFSENHFGESEMIGDFGGNGSAMWKLNAFENFLLDITPLIKNYQVLRINPYESLLIQGKIIRLDELVLYQTEENKKYLMNFLLRKISAFQ